jgi:thymidylate synthase
MFLTFDCLSANEAWLQAANRFSSDAFGRIQSSRSGDTIELLHVGLSIAEPLQRWVISRNPPINPAFALAEVIWIFAGRNDSGFLNYFNSGLPKFAGSTTSYPGAYGFRLRRQHGLDQLVRAYEALRQNPTTRQVVLQIWDARSDLPDSLGVPASADVPCNVTSILKIRDNKLEWLQIMRSNDLMRGLPYNLVQFTTLQEVLSGWLGVQVGTYNHISDSLHVYSSEAEWLNDTESTKAARNTDSLAFPKMESDTAFGELERACEHIIDAKTSSNALKNLLMETQLPAGFKNILRVLCAEGARKRKCLDLGEEIMEGCTNSALVQVWKRWVFKRRVQGTVLAESVIQF